MDLSESSEMKYDFFKNILIQAWHCLEYTLLIHQNNDSIFNLTYLWIKDLQMLTMPARCIF